MSDQTEANNTSTIELNLEQARALMAEGKPHHHQVLGALVFAAITVRNIDWAQLADDNRMEYVDLYHNLLSDFEGAMASSFSLASAMDLLDSINSEDDDGDADEGGAL